MKLFVLLRLQSSQESWVLEGQKWPWWHIVFKVCLWLMGNKQAIVEEKTQEMQWIVQDSLDG